ncbi:MAG TPA: sigma-70 family RNA polymerase sigma factor [Polyangiaceae bacterium]
MLSEKRKEDREPAGQPRLLLAPSTQRTEQVVREHFTGVWRLVRRYGLNAADADDVAQRTMMIAAQRIDEISVGSERPYLFRTALFLTSKLHRDRSRHPQDSLQDRDEPIDSNSNPEVLFEQRRARACLDRILSELPEELRVVFLLYELESFSQGEIAVTLGIPQGTVSSRLRRARECFAELMQRSAIASTSPKTKPSRAKGATP